MVWVVQTSLRRSPRSDQSKKYLEKGAAVLYVGSTGVCNAGSTQELNKCITKVVGSPRSHEHSKIFINSQDYLRVVSDSSSGRVILCVPVDVIVNCIKTMDKYIVFSAFTSNDPNVNTIHIAHVFECGSEKQMEDLYDALLRTIREAKKRADNDTSKVSPQFTKLSIQGRSVSNRDSNLYNYNSKLNPDINPNSYHCNRQTDEKKLAVTKHGVFRNAFELMKQGNEEKLHGLVLQNELNIMSTDDCGQTLLHLSVRIDNFSMCKFLVSQCCRSDAEKHTLRDSRDKEGMIALHLAAKAGSKSFVKFLATEYTTVNIKDFKGRIPLHYSAGKLTHRELSHILIDHGSKIDESDMDGVKPVTIEHALSKIQEHSVTGAFVFINNLNFLDRANKRIDSGVDITCSEKTNSEPEIAALGTSTHSNDSCYSPRQDNSLTSIPERERLKPPNLGSYSSWQCEEDSSGYGGGSDSAISITEKMRHLREELARLINLLQNQECHKYFLPHICQDKTAGKLVIVAQYPLLTDDCASAIALMLNHLLRSGERKANIRTCVENGLLKTLVRLLDSHVTIQAQSISIVEEIFGQNKGREMDYISNFAELDPELVLSLIHENDLPVLNSKQKQHTQNDIYAKRLRSLSSPSELGDSLKTDNSYFTKNWSRRLLIRILSRTSLTLKMRTKMRSERVVKQLVDLVTCPTMEIREHAICTLANLALSVDNQDLLKHTYGCERGLREAAHSDSSPSARFHASRALVYLGSSQHASLYIFERNLKGEGIEEDRLWSEGPTHTCDGVYASPEQHFVKGATLEDILVIMTSDPTLLWNNISLRPVRESRSPNSETNPSSRDSEIIRFVLSLHKTFSDTLVFFRLLVHRFNDPNVSPAKRYRQDIPPVHVRVCTVLCVWMEEYPWHFVEEPGLLSELDTFVKELEDYGPVYYDLRDQIALKTLAVQIPENCDTLDAVTHLDHYKYCRASFMNEDFPLSVNAVSWLSALRGVIEKSGSSQPDQTSFIRSLLGFKEREMTSKLKALIPPSYQTHPDVLTFTKNLYESLSSQSLSDREWQHLFVQAYFSHPIYKTELFYDLYYEEGGHERASVIVGISNHHFVLLNRFTNEIIGHHTLTSLSKPIRWLSGSHDNALLVSMDQEYRLVGNDTSDLELLATTMIKKMGGKIDFDERDDTFFFEDDEMEDSDVIATSNRHSWHASNNGNGYTRLPGAAPPTTPCRSSYADISTKDTARSRLSLNLSSLGGNNTSLRDLRESLRRVHTTNDVTMTETLKLVECGLPRSSITDRLRSFSTSISGRLDRLDSVRGDEEAAEDLLPKVPPSDLIGPARPQKRSMRRSPRISPKASKASWERGVVRIDPETAQETVIITEKCSVLYQLKTSGASTPSTPPDSNPAHPSYLRVRNMSSFKNIDTAAFTKLLAQSMELMAERKLKQRRNSSESAAVGRQHSAGNTTGSSRPKHRPLTRSKTFSHTFDKLVAAASPDPPSETPVELAKFPCLREDERSCSLERIRKAQNTIFSKTCDCSDVSHYTPCPCPPPPDMPYHFDWDQLNELKLLSYHREIARQLTLRDHALFADISVSDLLGHTMKRDLPMGPFPTINRSYAFFKKLSETVQTIILCREPRETRIQILQHFIDISHQCLLLRNYSSVFAIMFGGLGSAAVKNLDTTWKGLSARHRNLYSQLAAITTPSSNWSIYRKLLAASNEPTVPFLQIFIKVFVDINQANSDYLKRGLINLQKRRLIYRELEEVRYFQGCRYNLTEVPEVINFFMQYDSIGDPDDLYFRSEQIKRRERERSKSTSSRRRAFTRD